MKPEYLLTLIVLIPLIGALLNAFVFRLANVGIVCSISTIAVAIPFVFSLILFLSGGAINGLNLNLFNWITIPAFMGNPSVIYFGLTLDHLSIIFLLIITGVGSLIHLYYGE